MRLHKGCMGQLNATLRPTSLSQFLQRIVDLSEEEQTEGDQEGRAGRTPKRAAASSADNTPRGKAPEAATRAKRQKRATRADNEPPSGEEEGATGATEIESDEAEGSEGLDVQEDDVKVGASVLEKVMWKFTAKSAQRLHEDL
jgi:hypothetical protein